MHSGGLRDIEFAVHSAVALSAEREGKKKAELAIHKLWPGFEPVCTSPCGFPQTHMSSLVLQPFMRVSLKVITWMGHFWMAAYSQLTDGFLPTPFRPWHLDGAFTNVILGSPALHEHVSRGHNLDGPFLNGSKDPTDRWLCTHGFLPWRLDGVFTNGLKALPQMPMAHTLHFSHCYGLNQHCQGHNNARS